MTGAAASVQYQRSAPDRQYDQAVRTILAVAGALFSVAGVILTLGGYFSALNGSAFYIVMGLGLIVSGALVARRHRAGALTYMLVFAGTVGLALRNVEAGSILAMRLIGPAVALLIIAVLMPILCRWTPRQTVAVFTLLVAGTVGLGILSQPDKPLAQHTAAVTHFLESEMKGVLQ